MSAPRAPDLAGLRVSRTRDCLTLANDNTTVGYCRYTDAGEIDYLFVHPGWRRRGIALWMLARIAAEVRGPLRFQPPLSPAGAALQARYVRRAGSHAQMTSLTGATTIPP